MSKYEFETRARRLKIDEDTKIDIEECYKILKKYRCRKVFVFSEVTEGTLKKNEKVTIAASGFTKSTFFLSAAEISVVSKRKINLVDLGDIHLFDTMQILKRTDFFEIRKSYDLKQTKERRAKIAKQQNTTDHSD